MFKEHFKNIQSILLENIQNSEREILIAVAWFTNHVLFEAICKKISEGISVKLIVINDPINNRIGGLDFKKYIKLGGELRFSTPPAIMHHKFCIIDRKILFNGSYNWTYYAEFKNNENVVHYEHENDIINGFVSEHDRLCSRLKITKRIRPYVVSDEDFNALFSTHKTFLAKDLQYQARYLAKANKVVSIKNSKNKPSTSVSKVNSLQQPATVEQTKKDIAITEAVKRYSSTISNNRNSTPARKAPIAKSNQTNQVRTQNNPVQSSRIRSYERPPMNEAVQMLNKLKNENYKGKFGELRINLKWETYDDLDLHIYDPDNNHIYYSKKEAMCQSSVGRLDLDANAGSGTTKEPQENVYWEKEPPEGTYRVEVVHFASREKREVPFILSIITLKGESKILYSKVHFDKNKTVEVVRFKYKRMSGVSFGV